MTNEPPNKDVEVYKEKSNERKFVHFLQLLSRMIDVSVVGAQLGFPGLTSKEQVQALLKQLPYSVEYGLIENLHQSNPELFKEPPSHRYRSAAYIDADSETKENLPPYYDRQNLSYQLDYQFSDLAVPEDDVLDRLPVDDVERWLRENKLFELSETGKDTHYAERAFIQNVFVPAFGVASLSAVQPQTPVGPYWVDFSVQTLTGQCFIEVDGRTHDPHVSGLDRFERELARQNFIMKQGHPLFRFPAGEILRSPDDVVGQLRSFLSVAHRPELPQLFENETGTVPQEAKKIHSSIESVIFICRWFRPIQLALLRCLATSGGLGKLTVAVPARWADLTELAAADLSRFAGVLANLYGIEWKGPTKVIIVAEAEVSNAVKLFCTAQIEGPDSSLSINSFDVLRVSGSDHVDVHLDLDTYGTFGPEQTEGDLGVIGKEVGEPTTIVYLLRSFAALANKTRLKPKRLTKKSIDFLARRLLRVPSLYHNRREGKTEERQFEIVSRVLKGEDTFGIMPTGRGKSIAFQLPGLSLPGCAIVISPLRALMRDQVSDLTQNRGVNGVAAITFDMPPADRKRVIDRFMAGDLRILYVSPERLQEIKFSRRLAEAARNIQISFIAIDEAHCVSEWGHDFRLSYLQIPHFMDDLKAAQRRRTSLLALTATASPAVRSDVCRILRWRNRDIESGGVVAAESNVDRPELSLSVHIVEGQSYPEDRQETLHEVLLNAIPSALRKSLESWQIFVSEASERKQAGVVFCVYRAPHGQTSWHDGIGAVRDDLVEHRFMPQESINIYGSSAVDKCPICADEGRDCYTIRHANKEDCPDGQKPVGFVCAHGHEFTSPNYDVDWQQYLSKVQHQFKSYAFPLMVTTKAYGMGIDHRGIRFVVHNSMPAGVEAYYQEIGRAGRDGEHAHCAILYRAPHPDCVSKYLGLEREFVPDDYSENEGKDALPPCLKGENRTHSRCAPEVGLPEPCDLSRQLSLILRTYVQTDGFAEKCGELWSEIEKGRKDGNLTVSVRASGTRNGQDIQRKHMYLHRLKQLSLLKDFRLEYVAHSNRFDVKFHIILHTEASKHEQLLDALCRQTILHTSDSDKQKIESTLANLKQRYFEQHCRLFAIEGIEQSDVVWAVRELYRCVRGYVLSMRMRSFRNLHKSLTSNQCSRFEVLAAMSGDVASDYKCGFCSTCNPSLLFQINRALPPTGTPQMRDVFVAVDTTLETGDTSKVDEIYLRAKELKLLPTIARRAANHLAYVPDSFPAFYIAGRSNVQSKDELEKREGENQLSAALKLANEKLRCQEALARAYSAVKDHVPNHEVLQDLVPNSAIDSAPNLKQLLSDADRWELTESTKLRVTAAYVHAVCRSPAEQARELCTSVDLESDF